jgi:ammonia channel protein AmtB
MSNNSSSSNDTTDTTVVGAPPADVAWVLCSAGAIFFMQAGFMFLEAGGVSRKNLRNSMFKTYI